MRRVHGGPLARASRLAQITVAPASRHAAASLAPRNPPPPAIRSTTDRLRVFFYRTASGGRGPPVHDRLEPGRASRGKIGNRREPAFGRCARAVRLYRKSLGGG